MKYPIEFDLIEGWFNGKHFYALHSKDFGFYTLHNNFEIAKTSIRDGLNLMINSYLFEPDYVVSKKAMKLRNIIKRHIYG